MPSVLLMKSSEDNSLTEESHDKHKERAFVAASRRTDRSIEARLQSAHRASEIHQKRTGKAFRISEAIIMNEEMYEEEDDFPRSHQLLPPHMLTSSAKMNSRVDSYLTSRAAMSALAAQKSRRESEVNDAFAQFFPKIDQNLSQHWPAGPLGTWFQAQSDASNSQPFAHDESVDQQPEELLSESEASTNQPGSPLTPQFAFSGPEAQSLAQSFSGIDAMSDGGAFTSDLPPEARMLIGYTDQHGMPALSSNNQGWAFPAEATENCGVPSGLMEGKNQFYNDYDSTCDNVNSIWDSGSQFDCQMDDVPWDDFINEMSQVRNG